MKKLLIIIAISLLNFNSVFSQNQTMVTAEKKELEAKLKKTCHEYGTMVAYRQTGTVLDSYESDVINDFKSAVDKLIDYYKKIGDEKSIKELKDIKEKIR